MSLAGFGKCVRQSKLLFITLDQVTIMKTNSTLKQTNPSTPVVFSDDFNSFEPINSTQAWSLFLTASHEDTLLGENPQTGNFWNYSLLIIVLVGAAAALIYSHFIN